MGLIIISTDNQQEQKSPPKDESCIVCGASRPEGFANEIEKIFWALNSMTSNQMATADEKMCPVHAKRAKGLKIYSSKDELFELDPTSAFKERPTANPISELEYNKAAEIEDVETTV